jgi:hypothetical protein
MHAASRGEIRLETLGRILEGDETGRVVEVWDDSANTGGFLIFTYADVDRSPEVFDAWVATMADVESYFAESNWRVHWAES